MGMKKFHFCSFYTLINSHDISNPPLAIIHNSDITCHITNVYIRFLLGDSFCLEWNVWRKMSNINFTLIERGKLVKRPSSSDSMSYLKPIFQKLTLIFMVFCCCIAKVNIFYVIVAKIIKCSGSKDLLTIRSLETCTRDQSFYSTS